MSELSFAVSGARPEPYAVSPQLALRMRVAEASGVPVYAIALRAQVQIEPQRRRYAVEESERLTELFGGPERYGQTLRTMLWTHVSATVLAFEGETEFDLVVPCSYDFAVAANAYLSALEDGEIPIVVQLSGTVFVRGENGVAAELVPWTCEARYRLPVAVYRATMEAHFPNSAWIRIDRDTFDELYRFKREGGFPTWEAAFAQLCARAEAAR
ncbi:MAG TPA: DUF6084 family protein [Candidatus Elarobacter sp.]|nr:DUF6084 family protein [Candidatus Elarobacter sp.]